MEYYMYTWFKLIHVWFALNSTPASLKNTKIMFDLLKN